jgi:uncharacterized RDD family membrane protein YckC
MKTNAGFWLRFVAIFIDGIVLSILQFVVIAPILGVIGFGMSGGSSPMDSDDPTAMIAKMMAIFSSVGIVLQLVQILYFALMESSKYQATLGKLALGLIVTDVNGGKLDFVKALIRNISKIVSWITLGIGFIMAGFTEKKQGLHDIITGTLVVKK